MRIAIQSRQVLAGCLLTALLVALGPTGCTVWGAKKHPHKFKDTTSAEQYERIFWKDVREHQWKEIRRVLASNVVYTAEGKAIQPDQIIPYLQSLGVDDFLISNVVVKPNGADMTLTFNIQIQRSGRPPESFVDLSVWQLVHHGRDLILIAHSQQPAAGATSAPSQ